MAWYYGVLIGWSLACVMFLIVCKVAGRSDRIAQRVIEEEKRKRLGEMDE